MLCLIHIYTEHGFEQNMSQPCVHSTRQVLTWTAQLSGLVFQKPRHRRALRQSTVDGKMDGDNIPRHTRTKRPLFAHQSKLKRLRNYALRLNPET